MLVAYKLDQIKNKCGFMNGISLSSNGRLDRIGFWWDEIVVQIISYFEHHFLETMLDLKVEGYGLLLGCMDGVETLRSTKLGRE